MPRNFVVSWLRNMAGGVNFALLMFYCDLNVGTHTGIMSFGVMESDASDENFAFLLLEDEMGGPYFRQLWEGTKQTTPITSRFIGACGIFTWLCFAYVHTKIPRIIGDSGVHTGSMSYDEMECDASDMNFAILLLEDETGGPYFRQQWEGTKLTTPIISHIIGASGIFTWSMSSERSSARGSACFAAGHDGAGRMRSVT